MCGSVELIEAGSSKLVVYKIGGVLYIIGGVQNWWCTVHNATRNPTVDT